MSAPDGSHHLALDESSIRSDLGFMLGSKKPVARWWWLAREDSRRGG